jgi:hypothetical protein
LCIVFNLHHFKALTFLSVGNLGTKRNANGWLLADAEPSEAEKTEDW